MGYILLVLIGLPGSGKTTLAKTLSNSFNNNSKHNYYFVHVCYDELLSNSNQYLESEWKSARSEVAVKIENLIKAFKSRSKELCPNEFTKDFEAILSSNTNIVVIADDNMYFKSMRYTLYQIARNQNISYAQIFLNCDLENAFLKNSQRKSDLMIPPHIIEKIHKNMEPPNNSNKWESFSLEIEAFSDFKDLSKKLFVLLNDSLCNPIYVKDKNFEEKNLSVMQCKKNVLHQTDLALRKIIGAKVKEFLSKNTKSDSFISALNLRKTEILNDIKMGNILLSTELLVEIEEEGDEKIKLNNFLRSYV